MSLPTDVQVVWQPQPGPQTALLECPVFEVFYGGARGGGKTEASIGDWLQHSSTYSEHAIGIFVRRKLKQLEEVIARTHQIFPKIGASYNVQQKTWTMPGGGRLKFVYLERDTDAEEYQGHNYTRIYVEEVTNFPSPGPINKLRATLRSGAGVPCGMRLTGNPGGPGHLWVKARYIDPAPLGYKIITESEVLEIEGQKVEISLDRVFIPSKLGDNALLLRNDPTYVLRLRQSGSEALVRAWLLGDWSIIDGAFFHEWDEEKHVVPEEPVLRILHAGMTIFRAMDWGSYRPFSVGWYAYLDKPYEVAGRVLPKDSLVKFREWYGAKGPNIGLKMDAPLVAQGIRDRDQVLRKLGLRVDPGVADPAIFIRNGGPSIGEMMSLHGGVWRAADNKRVPGAQQVRARLAGAEGVPSLYIADCCTDTIRTIPVLQHDETDPEDVDTEGEDHAYDELRYACMSRPFHRRITPPAVARYPKLPGERTINELVEQLRRKRLVAEQD